MYAVIKTGGKQYRVSPGDLMVVEKLAGEPGANVAFGEVLMVGEGEAVVVGAPTVAGASVSATLVEALNVDEEEIKPTSTLQGDLGAESIDFLDIVFRLEREFGIKIPRNELFPESIFQGDPDFVQNGRVTPKGLEELRQRMPFADLGRLEHDRRVSAVPELFTVGMVVGSIVLGVSVWITIGIVDPTRPDLARFDTAYYTAILCFLWIHYYHDHFLFTDFEAVDRAAGLPPKVAAKAQA